MREDVELIQGVYEDFDAAPYLSGEIAPVFFGSAVNNFGVKEMLDTFIEFAPNPKKNPLENLNFLLNSSKYSLPNSN